MVTHTCNLSIGEVETRGSWGLPASLPSQMGGQHLRNLALGLHIPAHTSMCLHSQVCVHTYTHDLSLVYFELLWKQFDIWGFL